MQVTVTQEDIDRGKRFDANYCAVALALHRKTRGGVTVGCESADVDGRYYRMPRATREWVEAFDLGEPVAPRTLRLDRVRS